MTCEIKDDDLHLLDSVEPNLGFDGGEYFMDESIALADWSPARCVNPEDYEIDVLELYQDDKIVTISKQDAEMIAKYFEL